MQKMMALVNESVLNFVPLFTVGLDFRLVAWSQRGWSGAGVGVGILRGFLVSWFLGFKVSRFLGWSVSWCWLFFVSKLLGFKVSTSQSIYNVLGNILVPYFHITNFLIHVFSKMLIPYARFSRIFKTDLHACSVPVFFKIDKHDFHNSEICKKIVFK